VIDGCEHNFPTLAASVLPGHMRDLRAAMDRPMAMSDFAVPRVGVRALVKKHGRENDFSGCYVLRDRAPIYVGISRGVFARLRQHVTGKTHFDASLAYRMAEDDAKHGKTRSEAMGDRDFRLLFEVKKAVLRGLTVAAVPIENPLELHIFEAYAALELATSKWNTFRTH
jgi:hypothetical protein